MKNKARLAVIVLGFLVASASAISASERISKLLTESYVREAEGNYQKALNATLEILRQQPKSYLANLRTAWLLYRLQRYAESVTRYSRTHELAPKSFESRLGKMLPLMALRRWSEAEAIARELLALDRYSYLLNSRMALILYSSGRYGEALKYYRFLSGLYPSDTEMRLGTGWTYLKMGNHREAARWFDSVQRMSPGNLRARAGKEEISRLASTP